jgi:hypothetical protein
LPNAWGLQPGFAILNPKFTPLNSALRHSPHLPCRR